MANQNVVKQQTFGRYDVCGTVKGLGADSIQLQTKGKNNVNWVMNKLNLRLDDGQGGSFFMNTQDGFDIIKGKDLYMQDQDGNQLVIKFGDRTNEHVLERIADRSFIKVGYDVATIKDENGREYPGWLYKQFTCVFDMIGWLKEVLEEDMLVKFSGSLRMNTYNGETNYQYEIQRAYIQQKGKELPEGFKGLEAGFNFTQTMLLDENSVDISKLDEEGVVCVTGYIYTLENKKDAKGGKVTYKDDEGKARNVKVPKVFPMQYVVRGEDEKKKETVKKLVEKFLMVEEGTVKKITMNGKFKQGFIKKSLTEADLTEEMRELIELGLYDMEEVLKMNSGGDRVKELSLHRPLIEKDKDGNLKLDIDVKTYVPDDIHMNLVELDEVVRTNNTASGTGVSVSAEDEDLLSELDDL
ncbi:MAG: hypothetical protein ACRC1P_09645 [Cellulosilyticaceae bacterium]